MEIRIRPTNERCGPTETHAVNVIANLIDLHGVELMTLTLRVFAETSEANKLELRSHAIYAVHDICRGMPRWTALGMPFLEAWDAVDIGDLRRQAKTSGLIQIGYKTRAVLCTLMLDRLRPQLERLVVKPAAKPAAVKALAKPPRSLTRISEVERNIALGHDLLVLRATVEHNLAFGRQMRRRFEIEGKLASQIMRATRAYGTRPEIFTRLSWNALVTLASPKLPDDVRASLEAEIIAGRKITAPIIRAARRPPTVGKRRSTSDRRMAA